MQARCTSCGERFSTDVVSGELVCPSCSARIRAEDAHAAAGRTADEVADPGQAVRTDTARLNCSGRVCSVATSPDGTMLAAGCDDSSIGLWSLPGLEPIRTLRASSGAVWSVAFSADSASIGAACEARMAIIWDVSTGKRIETLADEHRAGVHAIAFSSDRVRAATVGAERALVIWDAQFGLSLKTVVGHETPLWSVAISPGGTSLAAGSEDGTVSFWSFPAGARVASRHGREGAILSLCYSPDGHTLAVGEGPLGGGSEGRVLLWDTLDSTVERVLTHRGAVRGVRFSSDGTRLLSASCDSTVAVWSVADGRKIHEYDGHDSWVWSAAFIDDRRVASGGSDRSVHVWSID